MKLKRFSQINYKEEEKIYFNPITRLKRISQKIIGRARYNLSDKIDSSIESKTKKSEEELIKRLRKLKENTNKDNLNSKLNEEASTRGYDIINSPWSDDNLSAAVDLRNNTDYINILSKSENKSERDYAKKLKIILDTKNPPIVIQKSQNTNPGELAHEIGHVMNYYGERDNPLRKVLNNPGKINGKSRERFLDNMENINSGKNIKPFKTWIDGKLVIYEEGQASKKGLKLLKKVGATKDDLKLEKERLSVFKDSYKIGANHQTGKALSDLVELPFWRGKRASKLKHKQRRKDILHKKKSNSSRGD